MDESTTLFDGLFDSNETASETTTPATLMTTLAEFGRNVSTRRPCENVIVHDGHLFICLEKVNFLLMIASLFFILFIMFSVIGNLTVILAILKEKRLRTPSSYLILSLGNYHKHFSVSGCLIRLWSNLVTSSSLTWFHHVHVHFLFPISYLKSLHRSHRGWCYRSN